MASANGIARTAICIQKPSQPELENDWPEGYSKHVQLASIYDRPYVTEWRNNVSLAFGVIAYRR